MSQPEWKHTIGDIVYSILTGRKMMVLDQVHLSGNLTSESGYTLRTTDYKEQFLFDFEVTDVEPTAKKPKQEESNNEE